MNFAKNLKKLRNSAKLTQAQLANALNNNRQNITNWENGTTIPDIKVIDLIAQFFKVSIDDLIHGDDTSLALVKSKISNESVPYYDLVVTAGACGALCADSRQYTPSGYINMPGLSGSKAAFKITGISMEPEIKTGDIIGIKPVENLNSRWNFLKTGKIYLIVTREDRMIKYIKEASNPDYIVCESPNWSTFQIYKGDILEIYEVAALVRLF